MRSHKGSSTGVVLMYLCGVVCGVASCYWWIPPLAKKHFQKEAVKAGAARYVANTEGDPEFVWMHERK